MFVFPPPLAHVLSMFFHCALADGGVHYVALCFYEIGTFLQSMPPNILVVASNYQNYF